MPAQRNQGCSLAIMLCLVIESPSCSTTSGLSGSLPFSLLLSVSSGTVSGQTQVTEVSLARLPSEVISFCGFNLPICAGSTSLVWLLTVGNRSHSHSLSVSSWPVWAAGQGDTAGCWWTASFFEGPALPSTFSSRNRRKNRSGLPIRVDVLQTLPHLPQVFFSLCFHAKRKVKVILVAQKTQHKEHPSSQPSNRQ